MPIKCAIFDLDGTITDSQHLWHEAKLNVLKNHGFTPGVGEREEFHQMELEGKLGIVGYGEYVRGKYLPGVPVKQIATEILDDVSWHYLNTVSLKPGMEELLRRYHEAGVTLCIATGSVRERFVPMLEKLGVLGLFDHIFTVADSPRDKHHPDIYLMAAEAAGTTPAQTAVFEDTLYSARVAKEAGFTVVGVDEDFSHGTAEEMKAACDYFVCDYRGLPKDFLLK